MACVGYPEDEYSMRADPLRRDAPRLLRPRSAPRRHGHKRTSSDRCASRTIPRFAGQLFLEAKDKDLALACVARVQRLDDRRVVRRQRRSAHPARHRAAVGPAARGGGGPAQRGARPARRSRSPSCRPTSVCRRSTTRTATGIRCSPRATRPAPSICMHIGSGSKMPTTSADAPAGRGDRAHVAQRVHVDDRLAAVGHACCGSRT